MAKKWREIKFKAKDRDEREKERREREARERAERDDQEDNLRNYYEEAHRKKREEGRG